MGLPDALFFLMSKFPLTSRWTWKKQTLCPAQRMKLTSCHLQLQVQKKWETELPVASYCKAPGSQDSGL